MSFQYLACGSTNCSDGEIVAAKGIINEQFTWTTEKKKKMNVVSVMDEGGRRRRGEMEGFHRKPLMSKHGVLTARR